jgi:hypothetical protein
VRRSPGWILVLSCSACRVEPPPLPDVQPAPVVLELDTLVYLPSPGNGVFQFHHEQPSLALVIDVAPQGEREALAQELVEGAHHMTLSVEQAEQLGLVRPQKVWMFGNDGPCEAKLGSAYALGDYEVSLSLELGYLVEPCAEPFAPVAQLAPSPAALRWRDVECSSAAQIDPATWADPERGKYEQLGLFDWADQPSKPEQWWVRSCAVDRVVVELAWSWVWPEQACWEGELNSRDIGWLRSGALEWLPRLDDGSTPELLGALVAEGTGPVAVFASGWPDLHIGTQSGDDFIWTAMIVGDFHDEVVAAHDAWTVLDCDEDP